MIAELTSLPTPKLDPDRLLEHIRAFRLASVIAVGDLMLDHYMYGTATRISPEAPVPVVEVERDVFALGGMANASANAKNLGATVHAIGVIADDSAGERLRAELRMCGVGVDGVIVASDRKTTTKTRLVANGQQLARIDSEVRTPVGLAVEDAIIARFRDMVPDARAVLISDYAKGTLTARVLAEVIDAARRFNVPVCVDPKRNDFNFYRRATVITPNLHEAANASRIEITEVESLLRAGRALRDRGECDHVLVTLGPMGMALVSQGAPMYVESNAKQVFDVTGAGDTAIATLTVALAASAPISDAVILANFAAGQVVQKSGTASTSPDELISVVETAGRDRVSIPVIAPQ